MPEVLFLYVVKPKTGLEYGVLSVESYSEALERHREEEIVSRVMVDEREAGMILELAQAVPEDRRPYFLQYFANAFMIGAELARASMEMKGLMRYLLSLGNQWETQRQRRPEFPPTARVPGADSMKSN